MLVLKWRFKDGHQKFKSAQSKSYVVKRMKHIYNYSLKSFNKYIYNTPQPMLYIYFWRCKFPFYCYCLLHGT